MRLDELCPEHFKFNGEVSDGYRNEKVFINKEYIKPRNLEEVQYDHDHEPQAKYIIKQEKYQDQEEDLDQGLSM